MQLSDIKKLKGYYEDLVSAGDAAIKQKHIGAAAFTAKAIFNYLVYGTSFSEFAGYGFYAKKRKEKLTYMTRRHMFRFFDRYDPEEYRSRIGDKSLAVKYYSDLLKREQFTKSQGYDEFCEFAARHSVLFIKKAVGWGGDGARRETAAGEEAVKRIWDTLTEDEVVEPVIENHEAIKAIYPDSLNTIKVTVLQTNDGPVILTAIIRFGNDTVVDNVHSGGMAAGIDIASGKITTPAMDKHFKNYTRHPQTDLPITGIVVPQWEGVKELALRASRVTPQLRYTSWDIAVTPDGPIMIEGNWDAEFYMEQTLYNRGHRKLFTDILEGRA